MKQIILALLAITTIYAGSYTRSNQILLQPGRDNVLNFACGGTDASGGINLLNEDFTYSFEGLPSWMRARGSSIYGRPASGARGPWRVRVNYRNGRRSGSNYVNLNLANSFGSSVGSGAESFYFTQGGLGGNRNIISSGVGNYVLLLPFFSAGGASVGNALTQFSAATVGGAASSLRVDCSGYESNIAAARSQKAEAEKQYSSLQAEFNTAKSQADSLRARVDQLGAQVGATGTASIDGQINQLTARIQSLQGDLISQKAASDATLNEINVANQILETTRTARANVDARKTQAEEAARSKVSNTKSSVDSARSRASQIQTNLKSAQSEFEASNGGNGAQAKYDEATANIERLRSELANAQIAQAAALQEINQQKERAANAKSRVDQLSSQFSSAQSEVSSFQQEYQNAEAALSGINFQQEIAKADADIENAINQINSAQTKNNEARGRYEKTKASYEQSVNELNQLQATRSQKLNQAGGVKAQLSQALVELNRAVSRSSELTIKLNTFKSRTTMFDNTIRAWTMQLDACKSSSNWGYIFSDWTCGNNPWGNMGSFNTQSGTGAVRYIGPDYIMVDNSKIFTGRCSNQVYRSGSRRFNVGDVVEFEVVPRNGKVWGRNIVCKK